MGCSFLAPIQNVLGNVADVLAPIAMAIPGPWQIPAMVYSGVTTLAQGGNLVDVVKNIGTSYLAGQIGAGASSLAAGAGASTGLASAVGGAASGATSSALSGGDILTGALVGGAGGYGSNLYTQAGGISGIFGDSTADYTPPADYTPTTDYSVGADYSLSGSGSGEGFTTPPPGSSYVLGDPNSFINNPAITGQTNITSLGLRPPTSPGLYNESGAVTGQGLTVQTPQGVVGGGGLTPYGASTVLGDSGSFINNPGVIGTSVVGNPQSPGTGSTAPNTPDAPSAAEQQAVSDATRNSIFSAALKAAITGMMGSQVSQTPAPPPRPAYQPTSTMPGYTPEYYQAVQQNYNQIMPTNPRDVIAPLQAVYSPPKSIVNTLFGVG